MWHSDAHSWIRFVARSVMPLSSSEKDFIRVRRGDIHAHWSCWRVEPAHSIFLASFVSHVQAGVEEGIRNDGRGRLDYRPFTVKTGPALLGLVPNWFSTPRTVVYILDAHPSRLRKNGTKQAWSPTPPARRGCSATPPTSSSRSRPRSASRTRTRTKAVCQSPSTCRAAPSHSTTRKQVRVPVVGSAHRGFNGFSHRLQAGI